jgi:methionyl-tRNA formyltransferase
LNVPESIDQNAAAQHSGLRLVMMGTGPFAVPTFESLLNSSHRVLALVTRPDAPAHRREKSPANPMREVALRHRIEVYEPASINSPEAEACLRDRAANLFVVCDYGQILSQKTLALATLGGINLHASLLPKYRGAAPINWAIYHGESETGITVIHMTPQLDAGPALVQHRTKIEIQETAPELETRLAILGKQAVLEAISMLAEGRLSQGTVQDRSLATKAPRLKKEDGLADWSRPAAALFNQVRALKPWPKTYTFWKAENGEPLRIILERVQPLQQIPNVPSELAGNAPGTVLVAGGNEFIVVCGEGALSIEQLQPAGKRVMSAGEFLRGHKIQVGNSLG